MKAAALAIAVTMAIACASDVNRPTTTSTTEPTRAALIGDWSLVRSCDAVVRAFREAGLEELIPMSLVDARYFANEDQIAPGRPCHGAEETRYVYFFEADGRWGMLDDDNVLVDDREFAVVDEHTIAFGDVRIDHRVGADGALTFDVVTPERCDRICREVHAWAVAAFASGSFRRVA
jgi:hypothetical protein